MSSNKNSDEEKQPMIHLTQHMPEDSVWNGAVPIADAPKRILQGKEEDEDIDEELEKHISFLEDIPKMKVKNVTDFVVTLKRISDNIANPHPKGKGIDAFTPEDLAGLGRIEWSNPSEDEFLKKLGRKKNINLQNLLLLVDYFDARRFEQYVLTRKQLAPIFKMKQSTVSYIIETAKKVDLIRKVSTKEPSYVNHKANVYLVNPNIVSLLERIRIKKLEEEGGESGERLDEYSCMVPRFEKKVRIAQRTRIPKLFSDARCNELISDSIPFLKYYKCKAARFSADLTDELKVGYEANVERTVAYITKIGMRFTTPYANYKKGYERVNGRWVKLPENPNYKGEYKEDFLERYFGMDWRKLGRYDVKSSIFRLTHFLNFGVWLPNSVDLYERILGHPFESPEERAAIKNLAMTVYFLNSAKDMRAKKDYCLHHLYDNAILSKEEAEKYLQQLKKQMTEAVGPSFASMIFVYESCMYLDIVYDLRFKYGYDKIAWIYDEWIAAKESRTIRRHTEKIIKSRLEEWRRIFIRGEAPYIVRGEESELDAIPPDAP